MQRRQSEEEEPDRKSSSTRIAGSSPRRNKEQEANGSSCIKHEGDPAAAQPRFTLHASCGKFEHVFVGDAS